MSRTTINLETMKKILFILSLTYGFCWSQTQNLPYISSPTIIPQAPTSSDVIKIVTKVTTPNQGIVVDQGTFAVTQNPKEIKIRGCYWNGMLTATQDYIDTLIIGQLPSGTYAIKHKAYLSSTQQHCSATDSNMVLTNLTVANGPLPTGLEKVHNDNFISIFPNPVKNVLYFKKNPGKVIVEIYSVNGSLLKREEPGLSSEVGVSDLEDGLYFIRLSGNDKNETIKFIKSSLE